MEVSSRDVPGLTLQVCFPAVRASVLDSLNRQREEGQLCDLSIHVQGQVFRAHRCVLAASSPYFHDQVLLKNVTTVSLPSVMDPVAFESVLSSAYTGQLSIVQDDIVNYVTVASFLQMWHIVDKCTEILKRHRPAPDVPPGGTVSRQQSPSSTDCLYSERVGRKREKKPDALPPLATWRRPQQFPRWGRQRSSTGQQLADSQLECLPAYNDSSDYSSCEEPWVSSQAKPAHIVPDALGHSSKNHGMPLSEETLKQKFSLQQQRGPERPADKNRESGDRDVTQERQKKDRKEREEEKSSGGNGVETKEDIVPVGQSDINVASNVNRASIVKVNLDDSTHSDASSDVPNSAPQNQTPQNQTPPAPLERLQWQIPPWSQQAARAQDSETGRNSINNEEDTDMGHFEGNYSRDTFDEIEKESGQVSQRPLVSPEFNLTGSDASWPSTSANQGPCLTPTSSSTFLAPSSPPMPSSSSSLPLTGAPFAGKVHYCHCGKAYALKSMRDRHVKMQHLNLRPFGCPVCNKSFKMKHHLTKHLKTHGGLRPFECSICGKKVIWKDSFLRHQARCQRLALNSNNSSTSAEDGSSFGYSFEEGEGFLAAGGQIKVEEGDFASEDGMERLLVSRIVNDFQTENVDTESHVFKEEVNESLS
ncbi:zinc finger and BTB domain-containing protein 22 [Periophthalmus magnuspinnatus]|uniref:zinc finger and BTB domain-containing protein 22 n=1 Tax=Periophthalmus magnuspinnatus TaxID=409849 RepID=UPI00145B48D0|nr:zinc finger and BTB domain-containing protein 22 [Periophthalmus magnuspinnatus]